jgi:GTPase
MKSFLRLYSFSNLSRMKKLLPPKKENTSLEKSYPKQHPQKLDSSRTDIIEHKPFTKFITPEKEVPDSLYDTRERELFESPKDSRFLSVSIVGPPNSGKSSLLNCLTEEILSAVSNKVNTTFDPIIGEVSK